MNLGIAISAGTFKGVFGHGLLSAFEDHGIYADAYACASSSVLSGGLAAAQLASQVGIIYWLDMQEKAATHTMSELALYSVSAYGRLIKDGALANKNLARLLIAVSQVITGEAAELTQGNGARRLGNKLLIDAFRKNDAWPKEHLRKHIFDSHAEDQNSLLTTKNFDEVAYASARMLHAWEIPAWIDKKPYIDASYTCMCPALELVELGCKKVIVISAQPGELTNDIFQTIPLNQQTLQPAEAFMVFPDYDLTEVGVNFTAATAEGMEAAYAHGYEKGINLVEKIFSERN